MANYDEPIEGRTMTLEGTDTGYSGDSLHQDEEGNISGDYAVYWYYNPNTSIGGITSIDWPDDFDQHSEVSETINTLLSQLPDTYYQINIAVYNYAHYRMWESDWNGFREKYGAANCVREV